MTEDDADKSLDDFFAKKDKSKKPKKKKNTKSAETVQTQSEKQKTKKQGDDWNDFEEAKAKDYSNLKIQTLQVVEDNANQGPGVENGYNEGDDEDGSEKKGIDGMWSIPTSSVDTQLTTEAKDLPGTHNVIGGKYIPPSLKRSMMAPSSSSRRPLAAPDIKSKSAFPTLSAANQDLSTPNKSSNDFEIVKRGMRSSDARIEDNKPRLDLVNRYDSLRN